MTRPSLLEIVPALDALPLFPLPQVVLFPTALLPLHVFEPRYVALVRDVMDTHGLLGIVLQLGQEGPDSSQPAPIASIGGVGKIVDATELPGGRYNIIVRGRARVTLEEIAFIPPYRRAKATMLEPSSTPEVPASEITALVSTATAFSQLVRDRDPSFTFRLPPDLSAGLVADACAAQLVVDARKRQAVLECLDVTQRVRMVAEAIAEQHLSLHPPRGNAN